MTKTAFVLIKKDKFFTAVRTQKTNDYKIANSKPICWDVLVWLEHISNDLSGPTLLRNKIILLKLLLQFICFQLICHLMLSLNIAGIVCTDRRVEKIIKTGVNLNKSLTFCLLLHVFTFLYSTCDYICTHSWGEPWLKDSQNHDLVLF